MSSGLVGATNAATLVGYGIQTEVSDYRVHVCFGTGMLYIYRTQAGLTAIDTGMYELRTAKQEGVDGITAEGYTVPWRAIERIRRVPIPEAYLRNLPVTRSSSTSDKGVYAMKVVKAMLKYGLLALELGSEAVGSQKMQIEGTDLLIDTRLRIQVKCDWNGGEGGTGNLFLQTAEANPCRMV